MACDISANIIALSRYTIGESGTITEDTLNSLITLATTEFNTRDPGCDSDTTCLAKTFLVLDYIERKEEESYSLKSEKIGDYSYTKETKGIIRSHWYDAYIKLLADCYEGKPVKWSDYVDGFRRIDDEYYDSILKLDQNTIPNLNNEY